MLWVANMMAIMHLEWRGWWQYELMSHILDNETSIVQGARQATGKTWALTVLSAAYIYAGMRVIIGMPTYGQATKILFNNINQLVKHLEKRLPKGRLTRLMPDNQSHICWANGGELLAISAGKLADKEGFTGDLLIIDEGHRLDPDTLDIMEPFVALAMVDGFGRSVISGVGGPTGSLIEVKKKKAGYKPIKITPERIIAEKPEYEPMFKHMKNSLTVQGYDQMCNCNVVAGGLKYAFDLIPYDIGVKSTDKITRNVFGIDVAGHGTDHTVVVHIGFYGEKYVVDDYLDISHANSVSQAKSIYEYVDVYRYSEEGIGIEKNGPGESLYDILTYEKFQYFQGMKLIAMSYPLKRYMYRIIKKMMLEGNFAITNEDIRTEMEAIVEKVKPNGESEWTHSDKCSAILVAMATQNQVTSLIPWSSIDAESYR